MRVFLAGIGNVGKSTIGACLARKLGCDFFDLDIEIEKHFGMSIERLRTQALSPRGFRKQFAAVVLAKLIRSAGNSSFVVALFPSGLMDSMLTVLAKVDCIIVVLNDSPENILSRITFYDADSRPIARTLTQKERMHYLREIEKDADYFGRSFHRADMNIDIRGLSVDQAAKKIQNSLQSLPRKN